MASTGFRKGQRLTNYTSIDMTVERVAAGGYGEVAMGPNHHTGGNWLAIKVLRPDMLAQSDAQTSAKLHSGFLRESLTWCGLWPHANVLTALFVVEINSQPMLVLDYAPRGSLRDQFHLSLRDGITPALSESLYFAQQIATGLVAIHTPAPELMRDHPIVHRDLKPENILVGADASLKITDFGLAKAVQDATAHADIQRPPTVTGRLRHALFGQNARISPTRTQHVRTQQGIALGTPAYMAPEQWIDAASADCPADVYAFGLILAELITGQNPLLDLDRDHTVQDWSMAHLYEQPRPLRSLRRVGTARPQDLAMKVEQEMLARFIALDMRKMTQPPGSQVDENDALLLNDSDENQSEAILADLDALVQALLAKDPQARPTMAQTLSRLQDIGRQLAVRVYTPPTIVPTNDDDFSTSWWSLWANTHLHFGQYPEALARIERALAITPGHVSALFDYGKILQEVGREEEALAIFRQALANIPSTETVSRGIITGHIGIALKNLKQYADAETAYTEAVALNPTNATAWYNRAVNAAAWTLAEGAAGHVTQAETHMNEALGYILQALALNPNNPRYSAFYQALMQRA